MTIDEKLMSGILDRDQQALADLYDRYHRIIWNIARQTGSGPSVCEQLVAQVFRTVWTEPQNFMQNRQLLALLIDCCHSHHTDAQIKICS
ncbi:RNA polymerase sigma factor [Planococcus donghaensis]|uniref:RNA polymerase sigma factor n=1 Tax=Planococcus donghaensis TaxID=414778 RepID=UPI0037351CE3